MIFYKVIKYTILDYCLDAFFNGVNKNFSGNESILPKDVLVDMFFSKIIHPSGILWKNCKIIHSLKNPERNEYRITFSFSDSTAPFPYRLGDDGAEVKVDSIRVRDDDASVFVK